MKTTTMAAGSVSLLDCSICLENFKQPKLLPCHHSFCATCLEHYIATTRKGKLINCPICRKVADVPEGGVADFQPNFYIRTEDVYNEEGEKGIPCEGCEDKVAANHRCLDCEENFCSRCTKTHMKMKMTRNHSLIELSSMGVPGMKPKIISRVFCKKHASEEVKAYCKQCLEVLCIKCILTEHQGHRSVDVTEGAREVREKLTATVEKKCVDKILPFQTKIIASLKNTNKKLNSAIDRDIKAIRDHGANLHLSVDKAVAQMEVKVKEEYNTLLDKNEAQTKRSETFSQSLNSLVSKARELVEQTSAIELIERGTDLNRKLLRATIAAPMVGKEIVLGEFDTLYIAGQIDDGLMLKMVGLIKKVKMEEPKVGNTEELSPIRSTCINDNIRINSLRVPGHGKDAVLGIALTKSNKVWVCFLSEIIELIDHTGKLLLSVNLGTKAFSVASDEKGNCIVSCRNQECIKKVTTRGKIETLVSETDGIPYAVEYWRKTDGREWVLFSCNNTSSGGSAMFVARYVVDAKATKWASHYWASRKGSDKQQPFQAIAGISVDRDTDKVCISDFKGQMVIILDEYGKVLCVFQTSFQPFGICFDAQGMIVVTENQSENDTAPPLRRFTRDGTLVETLTNATGYSIAIESYGLMWVGKRGMIDLISM